jgi:hypothetical protein
MKVGDKVFVRTLTHYHTGRIKEISDKWICLEDAAWIADAGRWNSALATGSLSEVEPFPDPVWIAIGNVCDVTPWRHELPRAVK